MCPRHRSSPAKVAWPLLLLALAACGSRDQHIPPPIAAADVATRTFGDDAPFDQACAHRSSAQFMVGTRTIVPNLHWDMEESAEPGRLSDAHAYSGRRSMHIPDDMEYSPGVCRLVKDVADTLQHIGTGFWLYSEEDSLRLTLVITIKRGEEQLHWFGKDVRRDEYTPGHWQRFNASFPVDGSSFTGEERICLYLWNRARGELFVDDWDLVFRSSQIPGRRAAPGIDLEQAAGTREALPFVTVTQVRAADPAAHGIRVGGPVLPLAAGPVVLPGPAGYSLHLAEGAAVGLLRDRSGNTTGLLRAWHPLIGRDLFTFERCHLEAAEDGILIIAYDVDTDPTSGLPIVAAGPAPLAYVLQLDGLP